MTSWGNIRKYVDWKEIIKIGRRNDSMREEGGEKSVPIRQKGKETGEAGSRSRFLLFLVQAFICCAVHKPHSHPPSQSTSQGSWPTSQQLIAPTAPSSGQLGLGSCLSCRISPTVLRGRWELALHCYPSLQFLDQALGYHSDFNTHFWILPWLWRWNAAAWPLLFCDPNTLIARYQYFCSRCWPEGDG
jgi:hypothetical protein